MTPEERTQIKVKIREEIQRLEKEIPNLETQTQPIAPDNAIGRLSRMEAIGNKSIQEASLRTAKQRLARLKLVLTKVDQEDFGLCRVCEEEIPMKRLMVMPEKDVCVACASTMK